MVKKNITVGIEDSVNNSLNKLSKRSGRKKNLLIGAALNDFLTSSQDRQEDMIKNYLASNSDDDL